MTLITTGEYYLVGMHDDMGIISVSDANCLSLETSVSADMVS